jgi:hypothetical protein
MKLQKIDFAVAILAGIACFAMLFNLPVWTLFIGWAWYFALGAKPEVFKLAIPPMLLGYVMAAISIVIYALSNYNIVILAIAVAITVFMIMLSTKTKLFASSLASFNTYSCMFAGYYAVNFPKLESSGMDINNILVCIGWLALANVIGLLFGFVSVKLGSIGA